MDENFVNISRTYHLYLPRNKTSKSITFGYEELHKNKTHELKNTFQNIAHPFHFCSRMNTNFPIFERSYLKN